MRYEAGNAGITIAWVVIVILLLVAEGMIFHKAGQPGWAVIVPMYNAIVLMRVVGRPWWWILLYLVPILNVVIGIIVMVNLAESFGKGVGYALGLIFFSPFFILHLGLGSSQYVRPAGGTV